MAGSSSDLAPPHVHAAVQRQVNIRVSSMNLGCAAPNFKTNEEVIAVYEKRLEREVKALVQNRDVNKITELNEHLFTRLMQSGVLAGYKAAHDGVDVCIIWDTRTVRATSRAAIPTNFDLPKLAINLQSLASPQVTFTAACTHSIRGGSKQVDRKTNMRCGQMEKVGVIGMENVIRDRHIPSLAAGTANPNPQHLTIFVGEHDHAVMFHGPGNWTATLDDNVPESVMADLSESTGEHHPLFFHVESNFLGTPRPASPRAAVMKARDAASYPSTAAPRQVVAPPASPRRAQVADDDAVEAAPQPTARADGPQPLDDSRAVWKAMGRVNWWHDEVASAMCCGQL